MYVLIDQLASPGLLRGLSNKQPAHRRARGFTLIEMMIVVGILGILAVMALPSFETFRDRESVKGAANNLFADMQFARAEAVQRSRRIGVSFTVGSNWCYGIHEIADGGDIDCNCTASASSANACNIRSVRGTSFVGVQTSGGTFGSDQWYLIDPRRGQIMDSAGSATQGAVVFTGRTGVQLQADLNAVGRVRLCSPDGKISGYPACS